MKPVLLTDFGSTYTKLTAVDLDAAKLLGTAQAYTTVASDVRIGFQKALDALLAQTGPLTFAQSYACSSAAGGLRMMVSGLVPELTMEAARLASLGAGAKIVGQFSFELTQDDLETIQRVNPDIFLLQLLHFCKWQLTYHTFFGQQLILKLTTHGHNLLKQFFDSMTVKIIMCQPF